jgi:hypothetical protein
MLFWAEIYYGFYGQRYFKEFLEKFGWEDTKVIDGQVILFQSV